MQLEFHLISASIKSVSAKIYSFTPGNLWAFVKYAIKISQTSPGSWPVRKLNCVGNSVASCSQKPPSLIIIFFFKFPAAFIITKGNDDCNHV